MRYLFLAAALAFPSVGFGADTCEISLKNCLANCESKQELYLF